jgi:uncharacterized protein
LGAPIWTVISLPTGGRARLQAIQREAHLRRCCGLRSTRSHSSLGREIAGLVSGDNMLISVGSLDQRPVQALPGYGLIYCGEPLAQPLTIAGNVRVGIAVQSDCPNTDFIAKLVDLLPDGRAMLLMDGVTRALYRDPSGEPRPLSPDRVERLAIDLGHIHHTFGAGHRIEIDVTSSNFPRRVRNTNSGHPLPGKRHRRQHPRRHQHHSSRRSNALLYRSVLR